MSLFFRTLRSGSSGNGLLMYTPDGALLIDLGMPARTALAETLAELRQRKVKLLGAVVTHEHGDHFSPGALRVMSGQDVPVWACGGAIAHACEQLRMGYWSGRPEFRCYDEGEGWERDFTVGPFHVRPIEVTHAPGVTCHAFRIVVETGDRTVTAVVATDLCHPRGLPGYLADADLIYLECNYDPDLLRMRPNPSSRWHLENSRCGDLLARARQQSSRPPQGVYLGHLSTQRNSPSIAVRAVRDAFERANAPLDFPLTPAPRHHPSVTAEIVAGREPVLKSDPVEV